MLEVYILQKLEALKGSPLIILRDPQRMIQRGARAVDGWADENDYTVLFCTGNLGLRDLYEPLRSGAEVRILLVDRSRKTGGGQLFYPDLEAALPAGRQDRREPVELSLRQFLVEATGDPAWPLLVEERSLARLLLADLPGALQAHRQLRQISTNRFSDADLQRIVLGAALKINPFVSLSASAVRRLCIEQHAAIDAITPYLPPEVMDSLRRMVESAPKPFCWLLERDPELVLRAFTLAAILRQHGLDHTLLLANLDPALYAFREIDSGFLDEALKEQGSADPEQLRTDVDKVEQFLSAEPKRLALLVESQLRIDQAAMALAALKNEHLSPLIRSLALSSLLIDLISGRDLKFHRSVLALLEAQEHEIHFPALRRPTEQWGMLVSAYRRAVELFTLTGRLGDAARELQVKPVEDLQFGDFDRLWNQERLNRLDFYVSDLERMLRVSDLLPVPHAALWPVFEVRWEKARKAFKDTAASVEAALGMINRRFQDLYRQHYPQWISQTDSPVIFTHQFLSRLLKAHWDPQSGQKAVVLVFDGMRTDAWD